MYAYFLEIQKSISRLKKRHSLPPEQFWYLNNGITVLCRSFDKSVAGGSDRRHGNYVIRGASVVNGAQTVGALASLNRDTHKDALETLRVTVRFIALDEADEDFGNRVTRATNTQNRIGGRDFVGLDPEQTRLRDEFAVDGLIYAVRNGEPDPEDLVGCSFDDAVVAIACSSTDVNLATQAKREVSKLYLDTTKAPYKTLFNAQTTSTAVWRRVQVLRHVEGYLSSSTRTWTDSREKGFAVHGNRLVLHLVFAQLDRKVLDDPNIDGPTDKDLLDMATERAFSTMKAAAEERFDGYLAHLFKNAAKVRIIRERAIQLMSSPPQSVSP
ncbi:AIPR family protein [Glutamicibacter arilaitensis]|uniref:AIPR family protein n=1 Tax=Glutamicibacter arilaitensis TaxID=256701 RepID=UPI003FD3D26F